MLLFIKNTSCAKGTRGGSYNSRFHSHLSLETAFAHRRTFMLRHRLGSQPTTQTLCRIKSITLSDHSDINFVYFTIIPCLLSRQTAGLHLLYYPTSRTSSGLSHASAIRLGIAIKPLTISASIQTVPVPSIAPKTTVPAWK